MAQINFRISGTARDSGERVAKTFPNTTVGDDAAQEFKQSLAAPVTTWYVRTTLDGRRTSTRFAGRRDAESFAKKFDSDRERGEAVDPGLGKVTLAEFAREWLTTDPSKRPSSIARDRAVVEHHLIPALGARKLRTIKYPDVQALVNSWVRQGLQPSTIGRQFTCLQAIMSAAVRHGRIAKSPCIDIKLPQVQRRASLILGPDVLAALARELRPDGAMAYVGAVLGLRWGEVAGLRVEDVDLDAAILSVGHQRTRGDHGRMVEGAPKSKAGNRTLSMPTGLVAILREHVAARGLTERDANAYLFVGPHGGPLHYSNWRRRVWVPACQAVRLPDGFRFHDLRRAASTAMVLSGVDVKTAQVRLGHSSSQVTLDLYTQVTNEADRRAAEVIGEHFFGRGGARSVVVAGGETGSAEGHGQISGKSAARSTASSG